jgi:hypothetical protein
VPWLLAVARNVVGTEWRGVARRQRLWLTARGGHIEGYAPEPDIADGRVVAALARPRPNCSRRRPSMPLPPSITAPRNTKPRSGG